MSPGINGLETYKRIIRLYPGQKAVIVSGYSEDEDVRRAQHLNAGPFIKKPYAYEVLGAALRAELDR